LIEHGRIRTTEAKAQGRQAVRGEDDHAPAAVAISTPGGRARRAPTQEIVHKLFARHRARMADRPGGYTRIIKIGHRQGDAALRWCYLELVDYQPKGA